MEAEMWHPDAIVTEHEQEPFPFFSLVFHTVDDYLNHDVSWSYPNVAAPLVEAMAWA